MPVDALLDALVRGDPIAGVCVVVAHPDDETAFAGLCLADRADHLHLVHLTDGAPVDSWFAHNAGCTTREAYAALRARELDGALAELGLERARRTPLGARDQEAADALPDLAREIARIVAHQRPALVITHAYEGGHPDHDAAAFAVRAALRLLPADVARPALAEMASYHAGEGERLARGFLPRPTDARRRARTATHEERARKRRALDRFVSQREVLRALDPDGELFRPAAIEDFGAPPHEGTLHYERHRWRLDGAAFRARVARAASALGVQTVLP
ncbi:PIG-L deacetylase family protein [Sandaracinus amylolyticus]|uniref:PIG-L deacetylase family protein n=1 Tax=Sandaracinus amylolyticus TaxID=927083 RepID=UPI001F1B16CB|nr:PIG-L family deacetylase [Sandaracinus amylolyticus]UJR83453.1 Hypothetical protein I5071_55210 [Sandaracinus amylolyticus]